MNLRKQGSRNIPARQLTSLSLPQRELFHAKLTRSVNWQKYDPKTESYSARTPMNSYDVLKCSQACFHLFEWLRSLLPEEERPPRCVDIDLQAYREQEGEVELDRQSP
ncbi:hypothetical protein AK812_SmicGene39579 [Symbiodinium microadriaticum]|uniref:Uncharacterized protein n=1 Tax=Symbiodinium microadriaticum TaxID=2951 RepID=A0A1Q9CAW9_SYMMI|nr:hypothetical protein AK812_SmicGene39579 [Symbiodinium microadriaticum]